MIEEIQNKHRLMLRLEKKEGQKGELRMNIRITFDKNVSLNDFKESVINIHKQMCEEYQKNVTEEEYNKFFYGEDLRRAMVMGINNSISTAGSNVVSIIHGADITRKNWRYRFGYTNKSSFAPGTCPNPYVLDALYGFERK